MASDPSIFAQANKPTTALIDPNTMLLQTAQAAQAVNANRLFQSNQARGELMQQSIDPTTGQFSPTAFNRLLAQTPAAALSASDSVGQSQTLMTNQNDLATKQNEFLSQSLGAVLKVPDAQLHDAAANAMTRAVSAGRLPVEQAMRQMLMLPNDPAQLRQHLTQVQLSLMQPGAQREAIYGPRGGIDDGGQNLSGTFNPKRGSAASDGSEPCNGRSRGGAARWARAGARLFRLATAPGTARLASQPAPTGLYRALRTAWRRRTTTRSPTCRSRRCTARSGPRRTTGRHALYASRHA